MVRIIEQAGQNAILALQLRPGVLPEAPLLVGGEILDAGQDFRPVIGGSEGLERRFVGLAAIPVAAGQDLVRPAVVITAGEGKEMLVFKLPAEYIGDGNGCAGE